MNRRPRPYQGRALPTELPGHPASPDGGRRARAGDGNRTRDVQLGRLMLYQLSYSRDPCAARLPMHSRRPESNRRPADYKSAALPSELRRPAGYLSANVVVRCSTGSGSDTRGGQRLSSKPAARSCAAGVSYRRSADSRGRGLIPPRFANLKGKVLFGNHRSQSSRL